MKSLNFAILSVMIFLSLLLNYSILNAATLYSVPVEVINKNGVTLWAESVQGKGGEEFSEAVQMCKERKYNEAIDKFRAIKERYPGSRAAGLSGLFLGSISFYTATLNGRKDVKLLLEALRLFHENLTSSIESDHVPGILIETGKVYLEMGRIEEAVGSFKRVIKDYNHSRYAADAHYMIALINEKNSNYKYAMDEYNIVIKEYPEHLEREGFFGIGRVFFSMHEYGEAKRIYTEGMSRWPSYIKGDPDILFNYSETQFQNGVLSEAREGFLIYYNLYPDTKKSGYALKRVGDTYVLERKGVVAEKIYREVMAIFPNGEDAENSKLAIGDLKLLAATGQRSFDEAIDYYKEVEESSVNKPITLKARYKIAKVLEARGRFQEALGIYSELLGKGADLTDKDVSVSLSSLTERLGKEIENKIKNGDYLGAVKDYQNYLKGIIASISDEGLLMDIADANRRLFLRNEAAVIYQTLIDRKGEKSGSALFNAGELYSENGDYLKAVETLGRYVSDFPQGEMGVTARLIIGESYYNLKEYDKAANYFYPVLRDAPYRYPSVYIKLSRILSTSGKYEESISLLKDILKHMQKGKDGGSVQTAYAALGNAYYGLGNFQEALDAYRTALNTLNAGTLKDDSETIQFMTADCLFRLNKKDEAKQIFSKLSASSSGLIKQVSEERIKDIASGLSM